MKLNYGFVADGGFAAVDRITGHASYAYPTSEYAERAKREPHITATIMIRSALSNASMHQSSALAAYDARITAALDAVGIPDKAGLIV